MLSETMNGGTVEPKAFSLAARGISRKWSGWLLLGGTAFLCAPTLSYLFSDWCHNENYSHGFFVPTMAAFCLWRKRQALRSVPSGVLPLLKRLVKGCRKILASAQNCKGPRHMTAPRLLSGAPACRFLNAAWTRGFSSPAGISFGRQ